MGAKQSLFFTTDPNTYNRFKALCAEQGLQQKTILSRLLRSNIAKLEAQYERLEEMQTNDFGITEPEAQTIKATAHG